LIGEDQPSVAFEINLNLYIRIQKYKGKLTGGGLLLRHSNRMQLETLDYQATRASGVFNSALTKVAGVIGKPNNPVGLGLRFLRSTIAHRYDRRGVADAIQTKSLI
jgi:hypothetical protein